MDNRGQVSPGHGWGLIAFLFVALFVVSYFYSIGKKSEDNTYQRGSVDDSKTSNRSPFAFDLFEIHGCEYVKPDGQPLRLGPKPPKKPVEVKK